MTRHDNPFALLGDDDSGDVTTLIAKVEAKISIPAPAAEQQKPKVGADGFPSKPLPPSEYVRTERGRGRSGRGRGTGRVGFGSGGGGAGDEADGQFGNGHSRGFGGDSNGRGLGRGGGRGGRGRGRGRGFYEDRRSGNENQYNGANENQGQGGDGLHEGGEVHGKGYSSGENRPPRYENGKFGEEGRNSDWEEKGYNGEARGFRGRGGRGYGGGGRGFRGGEGRRYGGRGGAWNGSENKEAAADGTEQAVNNVPNSDGASAWDMPPTNDVSKDPEPEQSNPEQVASEDVPEKKPEEEDNSMTLDQYEKLLQEKRKTLDALRGVERKVVVDKEFEGMQLVEKKKDDDLKLKTDKDKLKKKDNVEKEERIRKSVSINEFLKPAEGERYMGPTSARGRGGGRGRGRGRGEHGGFRGGYGGRVTPTPSIEDPGQFPILGAVAKA